MQIAPISQNMNNNETSFKRIVIINPENISAKLLKEIADNPEIREFAKYLHDKKADLRFIKERYRDRDGYYYNNLVMQVQNEEKDIKKIFSRMYYDCKNSFLNFFDNFKAREAIDSLDDSIIKELNPETIKQEALKKIEAFNKSMNHSIIVIEE